jgi:addiction module HigA family antidote
MRCATSVSAAGEEFSESLGLTTNALAKAIGVPPNRITAILKDERGITGDTAIRLGNAFQNVDGITTCVTPRRRCRKGEKEYRRQQERAGMIARPTKAKA